MPAKPALRRAGLRLLAAAGTAVALATVTGCATQPPAAAESTAQAAALRQLPYSVHVRSSGPRIGGSPNAVDRDAVDVRQEVEKAVTGARLFKQVTPAGSSDYELTVAITGIERPPPLFSHTVGLEATWTLVRASDRAVVVRKVIASRHTVAMSEMPLAVERARLAAEGAVRKNIADGLRAISEAAI